MFRTIAIFALLMSSASAAVANCAAADSRVRCTYVGPAEDARSDISARFVTAAPRVGQDGPVVQGGKRIVGFRSLPPKMQKTADNILKQGDLLPADVLILMNPLRYGLPRPRDGWTYFTVGDAIYRADIHTRRVLNYINPHINRY